MSWYYLHLVNLILNAKKLNLMQKNFWKCIFRASRTWVSHIFSRLHLIMRWGDLGGECPNSFLIYLEFVDHVTMSYSRKKQKKSKKVGGWGYTFLKKKTWNFYICHFNLGNFREKKISAPKMFRNYVASLGNPKVKNQDPWKFCMFFSWSPLEIALLF